LSHFIECGKGRRGAKHHTTFHSNDISGLNLAYAFIIPYVLYIF
jgi:hypothetical protein